MRKLTVLMIAVLLVAATAGAALAEMKPGSGAGRALLFKSEDFSCLDGASDTSGRPFGFAVMNTNRKGELIVLVSLKRAEPNTIYDIWVNQVNAESGSCGLLAPTAPAALKINRVGNGNATVKVPKDTGASRFWVSATSRTLTLRSTAVTLD